MTWQHMMPASRAETLAARIATKAVTPAGLGNVRCAELHDTYTDKADGPVLIADTGQEWNHYHEPTNGGALQVISGKLDTPGSVAGVVASYIDAPLEGKVSRIGARFVFSSAGSTDDALIALLAWADPFADGPVPDSPCHLRITPTGMNYDVWDGGSITNILPDGEAAHYTFATPLATDGTTVHEVECFIEGNTATVRLPDGAILTYTDALIGSQEGSNAGFEALYTDQSTDHRPQIIEVWADSTTTKPYNVSPVAAVYQTIRARETLHPPALDEKVTQYAPSPASNVVAPTSATAIDSTNLTVSIVAPDSGIVLLEATGHISMSGAARVFWSFTGHSQSGTVEVANGTFIGKVGYAYKMTGMTAGATYTFTWRHSCTVATTATFQMDSANGRVAVLKATPIRA